MNTPLDITDIRRLLHKWYDGTATPAEATALEQWFVDRDDIPADLRADAALFRAIATGRREADDDVPSDLEQRILRATVGRRPQNIFRQRLSAAAAVALLLLAGAALLFVPAPKAIESETYAEVEADPYIELTDSAQVAQTTLMALAQIDRSMRHAARGITKAEQIINN